jgi:hypothetical protein
MTAPTYTREELESFYADIGGRHEIAVELGVSLERVKKWITRRDDTNCPQPVRHLRRGEIYSLSEWRGWFAMWKVTRGSETWWMEDLIDERPDDSPYFKIGRSHPS